MAIPYQPNYKLQPKTGFRYSAQPFVPPQQPINAPPPLGLDGSAAAPPPVMGGQQGPAYANDPFGDNDFQQTQRNYANDFGYTQGTQNPAGIVRGIPLVGNFMADSLNMGQDSKYTFGNFGTQDTKGNVFGPSGQAIDPATGRVTSSFGPQVGVTDIFGSSMGQLGFLGYDENDMITPPNMRANQTQMDMGLTDASYAGLMSVPGEVSILGALDPNKSYNDIAGGRSYNDLSTSGTVIDGLGRAVTSTRQDGTKAAVTTGDAYEQSAAQQAYQGASKDMDAGLTSAATQMAGGTAAGAYSGFGKTASDYNANTYDDDDSGVATEGPAQTNGFTSYSGDDVEASYSVTDSKPSGQSPGNWNTVSRQVTTTPAPSRDTDSNDSGGK